MDVYPIEISSYVTRDGIEPFKASLAVFKDETAKAQLFKRIDRMRLGNFGDCKSLGAGLFELRIHYGPGYRIYFGREGAKLVILLCSGTKRTQERDIKKARMFWEDYQDG